MKSVITVAATAIAMIVDRAGALHNFGGAAPVTSVSGLTAIRRIVAAAPGGLGHPVQTGTTQIIVEKSAIARNIKRRPLCGKLLVVETPDLPKRSAFLYCVKLGDLSPI